MAGPVIATAEVDVDLDGSAITRQARRIAASAGKTFATSWSRSVKPALLRATRRMEPELRTATANVFRAVAADARSVFTRLFGEAFATLGNEVDKQLVRVEASTVRAARRITAATSRLWAPIAEGGREAWRTLGDEVAKQTTRIRVETRGLTASIANSVVNMREMLAPGLWDRWGDTARYHLNNVRAQMLRTREDATQFAARVRTSLASVGESFANLGRRIASTRTGQALGEFARVFSRQFRRAGTQAGAEFADGADNAIKKGLRGTARTVDRELTVTTRNVDREFRGLFGRMKGARNDFVNLIGVVGGALERITARGLEKLLEGIGTGVSKIGQAIAGIGSDGNVFSKIGGQIDSLGGKLGNLSAAGGPIISTVIGASALLVAFTGFIPIAGAVAAGISMITAALTALVGVLSSAALGALVSLGPILFAVGAGAGAALLGILGLTDELKKGFKPLQDWYDQTKTMVAERLFANLDDQASSLASMLRTDLNPVLADSADVLSNFADELLEAFGSDNMKAVMTPLGETLPSILDNLLGIVGDLLLAFSGFFAAISPKVDEVTGKIRDVTGRFEEWVNSAEGQNKIAEWFDKAYDAAHSLWEIIENVGSALGKIFDAGSDTGQGFLDRLVELTEKFDEWLSTPEGQDQLEEWFKTAEELAYNVERALSALWKAFEALNSPTNRKIFFILVEGVIFLAQEIEWLATKWDEFWTGVGETYETVKNTDWLGLGEDIVQGFLDGLATKWEEITTWWEDKWNAFVQWFKDFFGISSPSTLMAGFGEDIINGLLQGLEQAWINVVTWFANLPTTIRNTFATAGSWLIAQGGNIITGLRIGLEQRWVNVSTWFANLPTRIRNFFSTAASWLIAQGANIINGLRTGLEQKWVDVSLWFLSLPSKILAFFSTANSWLKAKGGDVISGFRQGLVDKWNSVLFLFNNLPTAIRLAVGNLSNVLYEAGRDVIQGFINGVENKASTARTTISNMASSLASAAKNALGISSPSRVFAQIGEQVVDGLVQGIDSNANAAVTAVDQLAQDMRSAFALDNPMKVVGVGQSAAQSGTVTGAGGAVVEAGAIQIVTQTRDPEIAANMVLDRLVERIR